MKKYFLIGVLCLTSLGSLAYNVKLSCGKIVATMSPENSFFESEDEWDDWVNDLEEVYCGGPAERILTPKGNLAF